MLLYVWAALLSPKQFSRSFFEELNLNIVRPHFTTKKSWQKKTVFLHSLELSGTYKTFPTPDLVQGICDTLQAFNIGFPYQAISF